MKILKGDYAIGREGKRSFVFQITGTNEEEVWGVLEKDRCYEATNITIPRSQLVANLGAAPAIGRAYGCEVEPFFRSTVHEFWGNVHYFYKPTKEERSKFNKLLDKAEARLKKFGITKFFPLDVEMRQARGKTAGTFMYKHKGEDTRNVIQFFPKAEVPNDHTLFHEVGHGVLIHMFTSPKGRAKWIRAYHSAVHIAETETQKLKKLLKAVESKDHGEENLRDFQGQLEESEAETLDLVLDYISDMHSLNRKELDILLEDGDSIASMWPTKPLESSDMRSIVTEYAMRSWEEFFCESFALHLTGKKLPKSITSLMETTLTRLEK